ncbi:hypothetical protein WOLCODRAFT_150447 [Wolfiporia cocos MD-104 SS10]|uniref:Uncharacterized protein n=1 Tax=Wolfiporia cocos (strain MD-104) TaxID=742152 RepID=A0A2H3JEU4_WOLCO|nr:hypothetical protein WOLCODRAFT_150447 [Wolfiporia cocos MD-104 SS10]
MHVLRVNISYGDVLVAPASLFLLATTNGTSTAKSAANITVLLPLPGRMVVIATVVVAVFHMLLVLCTT